MLQENLYNGRNTIKSNSTDSNKKSRPSFLSGRKDVLCILVFLFMFLLNPFVSFSQTAEKFLKNDDPDKPWNIAADELNFDQETGVYSAKGRVTISKADRKLTADFARFDSRNMTAQAEGNVVLIVGEDILIGNSIEIDLNSETGTITDGTIFIKEKHFYIRGDKIQKVGKASYRVEEASISTCDGDVPAWEVTGKDLKVTIGSYGIVKHAALRTKKVPILYSPLLIFPVKPDRQTGLLIPEFGLSDRKGFEYIQPLFLAIDESSDFTLYSHFMSNRGEKVGMEYRYILDESSKGALMIDYLYDRKVDDGSSESTDKWGYDDDNFRRNNHNRYWVRMKHDHALLYDFNAKLDIDVVSDQDYLNEFENGYTGFNETEQYFNDVFNRELDDYNDPIRVNKLTISRFWSNYSLNTEARWYDNVILRNRDWINDFTLQRLPFIGLSGLKQPVYHTPFYFNFDSEYTYFYSEDGTRGHRTDIHPRIYLPYKFGKFFTFEPSVGFRGTGWNIDRYENTGSEQSKDKSLYRGLYDVKLDLTSDIYKVYTIDGVRLKGIKHAINPRIEYDYVPYKNQDKYPLLNTSDANTNLVPLNDSINRINGENVVTYSITQFLTSKSEKVSESDAEEFSKYTYNQFLRFKLEQSYNIYEKREEKRVNWANRRDQRPFSPILAELDIKPLQYFRFDGDMEWCPYDNRILTGNAGAGISDKRNDEFYVEYRYDRDTIESVITELTIRVTDALSLYGAYERNIRDSRSIETSFGLLYEAQCWSLDLGFIKKEDDMKVAALINLYGLGGFGKSTYFGKLRKTPGSYYPDEYSDYKDRYAIKPASLDDLEPSSDDTVEDMDLDSEIAELEQDLAPTDETTGSIETADSKEAPADSEPQERASTIDESTNVSGADRSDEDDIVEEKLDDREPRAADIAEMPTDDSLVVSDLGIEESAIDDTKEAQVNETRDVINIDYDEVKIDELVNRVGITYFENTTSFYAPNFEDMFSDDLSEAISKELESQTTLVKLTAKDFPESNGRPQKLISGRVDNFALIEKARKLGLSAVITGSVVDLSPVREVRGKLFKDVYDAVRVAINAEVYDAETGTKILTKKFIHVSDIKKIDKDDLLEFEDTTSPRKEINASALNDAMQHLLADMGEQIAEALHQYPWKGFVTSIDNNRIIISSGSKTGLHPGNTLSVYDKKMIEGLNGHRFFIPGGKTGEILITDVSPDRSEALLVSGTVVREGSAVKKK